MTLRGRVAYTWRTTWTVVLALLVLTAVGGCVPQSVRQDGRAEQSSMGERNAGGPAVARGTPESRCNEHVVLVRGTSVQWSRDGSSIVFGGPSFGRPYGLHQAAADGSAVRLIDTEPSHGIVKWYPFDLSPDGRQIVYASCPGRFFSLHRASIDGTWSERLEEEHSPSVIYASWSPDGTRIASTVGGLTLMAVDGSTARPVETDLWTAGAPQWSPDGQWLAVTGGIRGEDPGGRRFLDYTEALYTVRADGSEPRRLVRRVASAPTWSPDGQWLAYARVYRNAVILAAIRADGTDERWITTIREGAQSRPRESLNYWISTVAWSPDGGHLLYSCRAGLCVVTTDGRLVGRTPLVSGSGAWSPDGARIAVKGPGRVRKSIHPYGLGDVVPFHGLGDVRLYTMAPDGTGLCAVVVARYDADSRNPIERLWRLVVGLEAEYPLVAIRDCGAAA